MKSWDQQNYLVIGGFCYIRPLYNEVPLYQKILPSLEPYCTHLRLVQYDPSSRNIFWYSIQGHSIFYNHTATLRISNLPGKLCEKDITKVVVIL